MANDAARWNYRPTGPGSKSIPEPDPSKEISLALIPPATALCVRFPNESETALIQEKFTMKRIVALAAVSILLSWEARAEAPTAEVAKKCLHFSYIAYPYKVPGKVHASPDRQNYFKACIEKNGDIPQPVRPKA